MIDAGAPRHLGPARARVLALLQDAGEAMTSHEVSAESLRVEVSHCPFLEVAEHHHDVVCSVHLGLMRGVLEQVGGPVTVEEVEPLVEPSRCIAHLSTGRRATAG